MADAAGATYLRMEHHDAMGRVTSVETDPGLGKTYTERTTYDKYGRLYQHFFTGTGLPEFGEVYEYNGYRYPLRVRDAMRGTDGPIYREVLAMDSRGHVTVEMRANEPVMTTQRTYEPSTGRLLTITSNNGALQQLEYDYDPPAT